MKSGIFLLLGSNLGDRAENLRRASAEIGLLKCAIKKKSAIYETAPWGKNDQQDFYNQVIELETSLEPQVLLEKILAIEMKLGRVRTEQWGPRTIDIDILLFGHMIVNTTTLTLPHPGIPMRRFVLVPLTEVAPDVIHPVLNKSVKALLEECEDRLEVRRVS
jgi:2-amino-4-hydroxy-6-hydroxymethyldihydropteridine diphosphokinase